MVKKLPDSSENFPPRPLSASITVASYTELCSNLWIGDNVSRSKGMLAFFLFQMQFNNTTYPAESARTKVFLFLNVPKLCEGILVKMVFNIDI